MNALNCKESCGTICALIAGTFQTVRQLCSMSIEKPQNKQSHIYEKSLSILDRGVQLVKMCGKTSPLNRFQNLRYASKIHQLETEIRDFVRYELPIQLSPALNNIISELKNLRHLYELEAVDERNVNETIVPKLTNDAGENAMMLQQIGPDGIFDGAFDESSTSDWKGSGKSDFVVGLEKNIDNLKRILLQREVSLVGVQGIGGVGKTTMALSLCNDNEIKGAFQNNIIFITVSQSPNLKELLETMWEKIVRRKRPDFQNVEDAHRQLQQQLLTQDKRTLVVLDDVWSKAILEKLLFEGEGYKTLVTTRDRSIVRTTTSTRLYDLPLLDDDDALPLFCFWAFGQKTMPINADEQLVKQVQAECKGLPLALKVIGSSLHGQPHPAWESAKNKLLHGKSIIDYHPEGLLRCLETSVDVLDEEARECFLDLGSFPEDREISVASLLDIWVYVRQMEWHDAFVILLELASRNLLNLTSNLSGSQAINYGSASELYFSQHDVMRDLALYLASGGSILRRKRLLMPKKEDRLPGKWELLKDQAFDAQIVSIHTDAEARQEPAKRQRRWNSGKNLLSEASNTKPLTTDTLKDIIPEKAIEIPLGSSFLESAVSPLATKAIHSLSKATRTSFSRPAPPPLKSDSNANGENKKPRIVPPPVTSPTISLKIERFLRPFTIKALKELLSESGTIRYFWIDQIRTHCYVTYSSVEEATATRNAVYNLKWPIIGGHLLIAEFVDPEEVKLVCEGRSANVINVPNPMPPKNITQG